MSTFIFSTRSPKKEISKRTAEMDKRQAVRTVQSIYIHRVKRYGRRKPSLPTINIPLAEEQNG